MTDRIIVAEKLKEKRGKSYTMWVFISMLARALGVPEADGGYIEPELCDVVLDALIELLESEQEPVYGHEQDDVDCKSPEDDSETDTAPQRRESVLLPVDKNGTPIDVDSNIYLDRDLKLRKVTRLSLFPDGKWLVLCDTGCELVIPGDDEHITVVVDPLPSQGIREWLEKYGPESKFDGFYVGKFGTIGRDELLEVADEIDRMFARRLSE